MVQPLPFKASHRLLIEGGIKGDDLPAACDLAAILLAHLFIHESAICVYIKSFVKNIQVIMCFHNSLAIVVKDTSSPNTTSSCPHSPSSTPLCTPRLNTLITMTTCFVLP